MSTTVKHLGFIPKNRGEYAPGERYYKDNIAQYQGFSFIADPVGYDEQSNPNAYVTAVPFDTIPTSCNAGWRPFALGAYDKVVELGEQAKQFVSDANAIVENYAPIQITGDVTNAPDEEDLTSENVQGTDVIKLKDKAYAPTIFSGLGRKYLRKNIVSNKNVLTQAMMSDANTIYVIQYDYDLNGGSITVPEGCILDFQGGSISNGILVGTGTFFQGCEECIKQTCSLSGTFLCNIAVSSWFSLVDDCIINDANGSYVSGTDNKNGLDNLMKFSNILFVKGSYYFTGTLSVQSNCVIDGNGAVLKCLSSDTGIIYLVNVENVTINNLVIYGDKYDSEQNEADCVTIRSSHNIVLNNITAKYGSIDGIYIGGSLSCSMVYIRNCFISDNTRNNISVVAGSYIYIRNCLVEKASGSFPQSGIDLEPNEGFSVRNVEISDCTFSENAVDSIHINGTRGNTLENISISNIVSDSRIDVRACKNIFICNCTMPTLSSHGIVVEDSVSENISIGNCYITLPVEKNKSGIYFASSSDLRKRVTLFNNYIKNANYPIVLQNVDSALVSNTVLDSCNYSIDCNNATNVTITGLIDSNGQSIEPHNLRGGKEIAYLDSYKGRSIRVIGITSKRPTNYAIDGTNYFDTTVGKPLYLYGNKWLDCNGYLANKLFGNTANRPEDVILDGKPGVLYYDSTLNKTIYLSLMVGGNYKRCDISTNGVLFEENNLSEGVYYNYTLNRKNSNAYFSKTNASPTSDDLLVIAENQDSSSTGIIKAPDPNVYPYIYIENNSGQNLTFLIKYLRVWTEADSAVAGVLRSGTFENRPAATDIYVGFKYFCTDKQTAEGATDGIEIIHKGNDVWVDALGRVVS